MKAAVIGAGPAGLMAAETLARAGVQVTVYEAKPSPARKFLMAGKSGLNLTLDGDFDTLLAGYGDAAPLLRPALAAFDNTALRAWATALGQDMFTGSTGRVFPRAMKASPLLRAWLNTLADLGVTLERNARCTGLQGCAPVINDIPVKADVTVLACGGASWARLGSDGAWANWIPTQTTPFAPSNAGVRVVWSKHMAPVFGTPVKTVGWHAGNVSSRGEAVLTAHGFEGGGVYNLTPSLRNGAHLTLDILPDLTADEIAKRYAVKPAKTTLTRWLRSALHLPAVKVALVQELARVDMPESAASWGARLKALPVPITGLAPLDGAISTVGGVPLPALTPDFMLADTPGVFCAGEMLDWDAPTG
ncbi:MAG: TIGR03862 family flavoprotein, partial [Paracoccaceae bacterium]